MRRPVVSLFVAAWALSARAALAQPTTQSLPTLPPPPPPAPAAPRSAPPAAPPASPASAPPAITYDATSAPPSVTTVAGTPAPYVESPHAPDSGARLHDGFYLRMASGFGWMKFSGTTPTGASTSLQGGAFGLTLTLGGTPARGFVFGGALRLSGIGQNDWVEAPTGSRYDWSAANIGLDAVADWFPNEHRGYHLGGMLGLAAVGVQNRDLQVNYAGGAVHARAFTGYDFWVGSQWSIGGQLGVDVISRAPLNDDQNHDTGFRMGAFGLFAEFTALYH